jgi:hypothetical protein
MTIWVYGAMALAQGLFIQKGGPKRWSGDFYQVLRMVPESPTSWAVVIFAAGALTVAGSLARRNWLRNLGLLTVVTWYGAFAIAGATAAQLSPFVGTTAPPTYGAVTVATAILLFIDERRPHDRPTTARAA